MPWLWDLGDEHHSRSDVDFYLLDWLLVLGNEGMASYVLDKVLCHQVPPSSPLCLLCGTVNLICGYHLLLHCLPVSFLNH